MDERGLDKDYLSIEYEPIGLTICVDDPLLNKVIGQSPYHATRDVSLELEINGDFTGTTLPEVAILVVPSTRMSRRRSKYLLRSVSLGKIRTLKIS